MELVDTHCHIHEAALPRGQHNSINDRWLKLGLSPDDIVKNAQDAGVNRLICVGTDLDDSQLAADFVQGRDNCWASVGIHPHEAELFLSKHKDLSQLEALLGTTPKIVAVGECGLDYYYEHSPKDAQKQLLKFHIELALKYDLPLIFHIREAFEDFWPLFDGYNNIRGVVHSFSATAKELDEILSRNLYVGLNGIATFTKDADQLKAIKSVPLSNLLLETDSPFLAPAPYRGKTCEPKHVSVVAEFLADLRGENAADLAAASSQNAKELFKI